MHASTFSGNALTMAAGLAAIRDYGAADAERINALGERLREGFDAAFVAAGIRGRAVGRGSLSNLHLTDAEIGDARDTIDGIIAAGHIAALLHLGMLRHGVMSSSRGMYCVSTPMGEGEIDFAIRALRETLAELRPYVEAERPSLLVS